MESSEYKYYNTQLSFITWKVSFVTEKAFNSFIKRKVSFVKGTLYNISRNGAPYICDLT